MKLSGTNPFPPAGTTVGCLVVIDSTRGTSQSGEILDIASFYDGEVDSEFAILRVNSPKGEAVGFCTAFCVIDKGMTVVTFDLETHYTMTTEEAGALICWLTQPFGATLH